MITHQPIRKNDTSEGLRARKRRETRARITEAGLRMFRAKGYDATTLDMIAKAADISRRTIFHYFDSKDAILSAWEGDVDATIRAAIAGQQGQGSPLEVVHNALATLISKYETDEAIAMDRLMRSTEALRARKLANYERQEQAMFAALIERYQEPEREAELRIAAMIGVGIMRLAVGRWGEGDGARALAACLDDAFDDLRATAGE